MVSLGWVRVARAICLAAPVFSVTLEFRRHDWAVNWIGTMALGQLGLASGELVGTMAPRAPRAIKGIKGTTGTEIGRDLRLDNIMFVCLSSPNTSKYLQMMVTQPSLCRQQECRACVLLGWCAALYEAICGQAQHLKSEWNV